MESLVIRIVFKGNTVSSELYEQAQAGNAAEVKKILLKASRSEINSQDNKDRNTALMGAAGNQHPVTVSYFLDAAEKIDLTLKNSSHRTALMIAAANGDPETVRQFLKHQELIDVNATDDLGNTALMLSLKKDNPKTVVALLEFNKLRIDTKNNVGNSALFLAAQAGHYLSMKELLKAKHSADDIFCALLMAASNEHPLTIGVLIERYPEIEVNKMNADGKTALMLACGNGGLGAEAARKLLKHPSIEVNATDATSNSALMQACINGWHDAVLALVDHPALNINATNSDGYTALMLATKTFRAQIVRTLLKVPGIDVHITKDNSKAVNLAPTILMRELLTEFEEGAVLLNNESESKQGESPAAAAQLDNGIFMAANPAPTPPAEVPPIPLPPMCIAFLEKEAFILGYFSFGTTKAERARKKIDGLQLFEADAFYKSIFSCADSDSFQNGVVYRRLLKCTRSGIYQYTAQCNYAEYVKNLKMKEFVKVLGLLGAKSITLVQENLAEHDLNAHIGLSGCSWASCRGDASRSHNKALTDDKFFGFSRPEQYHPATQESVNLDDFYFQDEWHDLVNSRTLPNAVAEISEKVTFFKEVNNSMDMSLTIKDVGLDVGGDYKRTTNFTRIYKVIFFCREHWD